MFFIILALLHLVLETTPSISSKYQTRLLLFDGLITLVFVVDFYFKLRKLLIEYSKSKSVSKINLASHSLGKGYWVFPVSEIVLLVKQAFKPHAVEQNGKLVLGF